MYLIFLENDTRVIMTSYKMAPIVLCVVIIWKTQESTDYIRFIA